MFFDKFKVLQKQHKAKSASFHTGKINHNGLEFNYIYDCGLNKKEARDYFTNTKYAEDIIFVSHFDSDHIKGLYILIKDENLKTKYKNCRIVLPYVKECDKFLPYFLDEDDSKSPQDYIQFINDERIIWVQSSNINADFDKVNQETYLENQPYFNVQNNESYIMRSHLIDDEYIVIKFDGMPINWMFYTHVNKQEEILKLFWAEAEADSALLQLLEKYKQKDNIENAINLLRMIDNKLKTKFKNNSVFKVNEGDAKPANLISMSLYSGPIFSDTDSTYNARMLLQFMNFFKNNYYRFRHHFFDEKIFPLFGHLSRVAWLHTGDANFSDKDIRSAFNLHYKNLKNNVGVFTLPHHGSKNSFHLDILPDNFCYSVLTHCHSTNVHPDIKSGDLEKMAPTKIIDVAEQDFSIECISDNFIFLEYINRAPFG